MRYAVRASESGMREEALHQLSIMNVTAATLFPDLGGLARSLRTLTVPQPDTLDPPPPLWDPTDPRRS
jgi:hypothetical protein